MKKWLLAFLLFSGIAGCGYNPNGSICQIQLAIYPAVCVDILDANTANGAQTQIYPCGAGKLSQEWFVKPINNGQNYIFMNENSQMCMSVAGNPDTAPGQFVIQVPCADNNSDPDEIWTIEKAPGGEAGERIINLASGQCLDLPYGAAASIFTLQQYTCDLNDPAQGWYLNPVSKGSMP